MLSCLLSSFSPSSIFANGQTLSDFGGRGGEGEGEKQEKEAW